MLKSGLPPGVVGVPYTIVEAVAYHHNPSAVLEMTFDVPAAVSLANSLVEEVMGNRPVAIRDHLESIKVIGKLPELMAMAREEVKHAAPPQTVS